MYTCLLISSCLSLIILDTVFSSLHVICKSGSNSRYSPTNTSICFLISGVNPIDVGTPIP